MSILRRATPSPLGDHTDHTQSLDVPLPLTQPTPPHSHSGTYAGGAGVADTRARTTGSDPSPSRFLLRLARFPFRSLALARSRYLPALLKNCNFAIENYSLKLHFPQKHERILLQKKYLVRYIVQVQSGFFKVSIIVWLNCSRWTILSSFFNS